MIGKELKIALDSTLRLLVHCLRFHGGTLVAIEFMHNGKLWRADTKEEAISLRRTLEMEDRIATESGEEIDVVQENVWTPDMAMDLLKRAGQLQKEFLRTLYDGDGAEISSDKIIKKLSLRSEEAFAGVLSGLSKQLKKLGVKPWNLYDTRVEWDGKVKNRSFQLKSDFRWIATEIGWPEKWF